MNNIICERRIYNFFSDTHTHEYGQLILPLQGVLSIETDSKILDITDDSLFFLPPDCKHTFNANNTNEFLVLDIPNKMLNKNDMNILPIEYIQNLRIKKAKELLLNTNLPILQISQMVGYEHNSSFTKVFKQLEKISPVEFRKNIQK